MEVHSLITTLVPTESTSAMNDNSKAAMKKTAESFPQLTSWVHPFTYKRFHVLLNSLFKVLCNFPSRYLFAIGLTVIFSLRWSLPPSLGCTFKQPDSSMQRIATNFIPTIGLAPPLIFSPCQRDLWGISLLQHRYINVAPLLLFRVKAFTLGFSLFTRHY